MSDLHRGKAPAGLACLPVLLALAAAAVPAAATAQRPEGVRARMEYQRVIRYSGPARNLALLRMRAHGRVAAMPGSGAPRTGGADLRWRPLGPHRRAYGRFMVTGRVIAVAIHPEDNDIVYAGGAQGGVWKTEDAGESWTPLTDNECSLAMGSIAIDPVDPEIVYAGTGEQTYQRDSYYGCGVLRTLDGGKTWEQLGADPFVRRTSESGGAYIARVVVDRATAGSADSTTVLVASSFGLFRSTDSGRTWNEVLEGRATDLVAHPVDSTIFFAAVQGEGVYGSEDGGEEWDEASEGMSLDGAKRINLAISLSDPDVLYATVETDDSEGAGLRMYRTGDGADTWERVDASGARCDYRCYYTNALAVRSDDPDQVVFGSVRLYRSDDGGEDFSALSGVPYVDEQLLVLDTARDAGAMYLANDGGVHRTDDAGATWTSLASNLAVIQFYRGIALHPSDPGVTLGGTQDQGTLRSSPGSMIWTQVIGGDGGYNAFDAEDPDTWYGEVYWIPAWGTGGPRKNGRFARNGIDLDEPGLFLPPLVMDPVDSRRLYFGTRSLYRTDDAAEHWERIHRTSSEGRGDHGDRACSVGPEHRVRGRAPGTGRRHARRGADLALGSGSARPVHTRPGGASGRPAAGVCGGGGVPDRARLPHRRRRQELAGPHGRPSGPPGARGPVRPPWTRTPSTSARISGSSTRPRAGGAGTVSTMTCRWWRSSTWRRSPEPAGWSRARTAAACSKSRSGCRSRCARVRRRSPTRSSCRAIRSPAR